MAEFRVECLQEDCHFRKFMLTCRVLDLLCMRTFLGFVGLSIARKSTNINMISRFHKKRSYAYNSTKVQGRLT